MEIASTDVKGPSGKKIVSLCEGRKPQVEAETRRNESNPWRRLNRGPRKRSSWNQSLSIRGRESIVFAAGEELNTKLKQRGGRHKLKQKKYQEQLYDFSKEKAYFEEVDAFELLEESPSPNKFTWKMGIDHECIEHDLNAILDRWRRSKLFSGRCTALPLSKLMEIIPISSAHATSINSGEYGVGHSMPQIIETPNSEKSSCMSNCSTQNPTEEPSQSEVASNCAFDQSCFSSRIVNKNLIEDFSANSVISSFSALSIKNKATSGNECEGPLALTENNACEVALTENNACEVVEVGTRKESEALPPKSFEGESLTAFEQLLMICLQTSPVKLSEVILKYCDAESIVKLGEGTYGEAFRAGETACKIVPIDGDFLVNGEVQKKSEEVLEEALLSLTLNSISKQHDCLENQNSCPFFIETKEIRVCRGLYDTNLIRAWEEWDAENTSENDHPRVFLEEQCYIVFVLVDGGKDLENFVLLNFDEVRSLLVQVTAALAVAEVACEFEHRDLHWGNILLRRNEATTVNFTLEGNKMSANTFGIMISLIDFTLSRINTGEAVLFLNLSSDPDLFNGPKGNVQFDTYRKMREVTGECWEESFPKTNVLWLTYLADILDRKKIYERTTADERNLRSFKRRLSSYESAKDSLSDPFFSDLLNDDIP